MIKLHLKNPLKLLFIMFVILLNNIKIKGCLCGIKGNDKVRVNEDNFIDLPKDDSKYKKIIEFIKNQENHKSKEVETYHEISCYIPLNIDNNIKITEEELKDIINKEIENIKNRTINNNYKISNKLGNLRFLYIIENDEIIPVKAGTFHLDYYYDTKNEYNRYKKTYIDYWHYKYFKKEVYSFDNLKKFWDEYKPDYLCCDEHGYLIFLFKKNEKNKQLFEKEKEKKHKHCSEFS